MIVYALVSMISLIALVLFLRGDTLHNYLVLETECIFQQEGFDTYQEHPQCLPDGSLDFLDLLVRRDDFLICIEVETSARYVLANAAKAERLGLPLIVIVPTRRIKKSVQNKLEKSGIRPAGCNIYILLLSQLKQELINYFPLFSPVNDGRENKKTNQIKE